MTLVSGLINELPIHAQLQKFPDRDAWLAGRNGRLGGGKTQSLYGIGRDSLYELWAKECGKIEVATADNGYMRRGRRLEVPILEELADQTGWPVEHWPQTWVADHPDRSLRLGCTPDAIARVTKPAGLPIPEGALINVQVKSVNELSFSRWEKNEYGDAKIPIQFQVQTQVELDCLGLEWGVLAVLVGMDMDWLEILPYRRDDAFIASMHERVKAFWDLVDNETPPPVDGSESTAKTLYRLHPTASGKFRSLNPDADVWADRYVAIGDELRDLKKEKAQLKNLLVDAIGDATWAETPAGQSFSLKDQKRDGIDRKKLIDAYPAIAEEFATVSKFRVLRPLKKLPLEAIAAMDEADDEADDDGDE